MKKMIGIMALIAVAFAALPLAGCAETDETMRDVQGATKDAADEAAETTEEIGEGLKDMGD